MRVATSPAPFPAPGSPIPLISPHRNRRLPGSVAPHPLKAGLAVDPGSVSLTAPKGILEEAHGLFLVAEGGGDAGLVADVSPL